MHFGKIKQTKTLLISRNEQLYILKEVENQCVSRPLSKKYAAKIRICSVKRFSSEA